MKKGLLCEFPVTLHNSESICTGPAILVHDLETNDIQSWFCIGVFRIFFVGGRPVAEIPGILGGIKKGLIRELDGVGWRSRMGGAREPGNRRFSVLRYGDIIIFGFLVSPIGAADGQSDCVDAWFSIDMPGIFLRAVDNTVIIEVPGPRRDIPD